MKELVKGQLDWHETVNENFKEVGETASSASLAASSAASAASEAASSAQEAKTGLENKLDKPVESEELKEGYVYKEVDGTVSLKKGGPGGGSDEEFKYTVIVDNGTDSSPAAVEYTDDCFGFIEANGSDLGDWANTRLVQEYFRPCVIQPGDGAPAYYLQKNNRTLKEDGTPAVLTGADGDVMIEVKKLYGKFLSSGNRLKISISNVKEDDTWFCFNDIAGVEKDVVYRGAYKAGVLAGATNVMRSVSGVVPLDNQTRATMRGYARARGTGYHQNNFYMLLLWQVMYLLLYRNRNSQTALGQGRTLSSNTTASNTGWGNTRPFCWGDQGGVNGVIFLGVEDFYGNVWEWVDGVCLVNKVYKLTRDPAKYNDTGDGYEISEASGLIGAANNDKYVTKVKGTNDLGFLPKASGGSSNTFWCDNVGVKDNVHIVRFGGLWFDAAKVGAFFWVMYDNASHFAAGIGSRLCRA